MTLAIYTVVTVSLALLGLLHESYFKSSTLFVYSYPLFGLCLAALLQQVFKKQHQQTLAKLKKFEEQVNEASVLREIGLMAAGMAHNFKNYLGVLEGTTNIISDKKGAEKTIDTALRIQTTCLSQALGVVNKILWFAKKDTENPTASNRPINDVVNDAIDLAELIIKERNIRIKRELAPSRAKVDFNEISLIQCVLNLIKNAAEASSEGSEILVRTEIQTHQHTQALTIAVRDFGVGISSDRIPRLFSPMQTTKSNGNGLGLFTVKQLVESEGGEVEVSSVKDKGTEIRINIPVNA